MSRFSVKKPLTVFVVVVIIIALGVVSLLNMTPDLLPSIDLPYMLVMTTYPGATPEEVEEGISKPLEKGLATLENLKSINSVSNANYSMVILEFENGASMDSAVVNALQSIDLVESGWDEKIGSPNIMKLNPNMMPIMVAAVDKENSDVESLSNEINNVIMSKLEGTTGVASISGSGLLESKVNVNINDKKIEKLNEELLGEASPSMAKAKKQINDGFSALKKAESQLKESRQELEKQKEETYDQLASASAQLDVAVSQASAIATQISVLEGRKAAIEAQLSQGIYGPEVGTSLQQLEEQLADVQGQLALLQMDSQTANANLEKMQEAYKEAERGSYTAIESFGEAKEKLASAEKQLKNQKSQLNQAKAQLDSAGNQSLQAKGLGSMITMDMISGVLQGQNFSMPAGYVQDNGVKYLVSVGDKIQDVDELKKMFLFNIDGLGDIYLEDVADVFISDNSDAIYGNINGNPGVLLSFFKQSNYPTATVSNNIKDTFEKISSEDSSITFTPLMDQGDYIYLIISSILQSLAFGALFAIIILFIFLKDIKPTFITLLSIPISVTFAIVLMYFSGITLNLISLSGLAVAVGMLVDNSIVVIENIFRYRREGVDPKRAAVAGAKEVASAITASTLTTVCVFAPIVFVQGITRQLFTDMALTVGYALLASLIIALTLVPAMSSMMFKKEVKPEGKGFVKFKAKYKKFLAWNLKHKVIVLLFTLILLFYSVFATLEKGFIFMPDMSTPQLSGTMTMVDEEAGVDETAEVADKVLERLRNIEGVETVGGMLSSGGMLSMESQKNAVSLYIIVDQESGVSGGEIAKEAKEVCKGLPCEVDIMSSSSMTEYTSGLGGSGVVVNIFGNDNDNLQMAAKRVGDSLEKIEGVSEVDNGLVDAEKEIHFTVDKEKAMKKGLTVAQVYMAISKALTNETTSTSLNIGGTEEDVIVTKGEKDQLNISDLKNLEIEGKDSDGNVKMVKLKYIAKMSETLSLPSIKRIDQQTYISVTATVKEGYNVTLISNEAEKVVSKVQLPDGITYSFSGENETIMDAMSDLVLMLLLGVLFVYLIMVAQFQSLKSPFIVMFTIPLAFTGGFLALLITGKELSIIAMIGLIMLVGIIVNNGIVLVDYINQLRGRGMSKKDAILEAGATRMRPVIMTSLTTILGLLVMAFGNSAGTDMMQPIALVCIGGLAYATLLTLLVVPVIYDLVNGEKYKGVKNEDVDVSDLLME